METLAQTAKIISAKRTLAIAMATVFLDLIGFGILIPVQPFLALSFGASPSKVTLLGTAFSLMQFLFVPMWGRISDRIGRRPIMLASIALTATGFLIFGLAQNIWILFFARMMSGLGSANIGIAQAIIADSTSQKNRAQGMGLIGLAFGLGLILGPAIGGIFGRYGFSAPAFAAAALSFTNLMLAYVFLIETNEHKTIELKSEKHLTVKKILLWPMELYNHVRASHMDSQVFALLSASLILSLAFSMFEQSIGLFIQSIWAPELSIAVQRHTNSTFGIQHAVRLTTYFLLVVGITAVIIQGGLTGRLVNRFGEKRLMMTGALLLSFGFFLVPVWGMLHSFPMLLCNATITATGLGLMTPSIGSLLSKSASVYEQGAVLGLGQSTSALGRVLGPSMAGFFFEVHRGSPFMSASAFMLVSFLFIWLGIKDKLTSLSN